MYPGIRKNHSRAVSQIPGQRRDCRDREVGLVHSKRSEMCTSCRFQAKEFPISFVLSRCKYHTESQQHVQRFGRFLLVVPVENIFMSLSRAIGWSNTYFGLIVRNIADCVTLELKVKGWHSWTYRILHDSSCPSTWQIDYYRRVRRSKIVIKQSKLGALPSLG